MRIPLVLLTLLAAACGGATHVDPAPPTFPALPVARTEVAGALWNGTIAVVGGLTADGQGSDRVDLYDPATNGWSSGPSLPMPLHHLGLAVAGDRLYAAGGYTNDPTGSWSPQARVVSIGVGESQWRDEPPLSHPRGGLAMVALGDRLVVMGGVVAGQASNTVEVLDRGASSWRSAPPMAQARDHLAATASGDRVYAIAGRVTGLETNLRSVESWSPGEPAWRSEPAVRHSRGGTSAATVGTQPCVAGGEEPQGTIASVECLTDGRWRDVAGLTTPRHGLAVVAVGSRVHVIGGGPEPGLFVSDAHEVLDITG